MDFEVFTFGGGEYLRLVFNGAAALMGGGDYMLILRTAALCGLLGVLVRAAYKGSMVEWQWLLAVIGIYYVVLQPRANVIINDRLDPGASAVVGNVPLGLAFVASSMSAFRNWATEASEAVYSLPDDIQYTQSGMLFGSRLVEASSRFEFTDGRTAANLSEFWQQCVFYDLLLGRYGMNEMQAAPDLWAFLQGHTSQVRAFPYTDASNTRSILVCRNGIASGGPLDADIVATTEAAKRYYGDQLVRLPDRNAAIAKFASAMPTSYQYLTGLSMSAEQIIRQTALGNSMKRGISAWASRVDAPAAAQDYAMARAEAERNTTFGALGQFALRNLPIVQNIVEAFVYAAFPFAFMLCVLPIGAKVAMAYVKVLFWISMWAPLYAILHLAMMVFGRGPAESALRLADGSTVLSIANYTGLGQVMADHAAFAGYLTLSIPMISWMFVSASGAMLAAAVGRVVSSYESAASRGAQEATSGNIQLGNTGFGNASWWQENTAPSSQSGTFKIQGADGVGYTQTSAGTYAQLPSSSLPIRPSLEQSVRTSLNEAAESSTRAARSDVASLGQSTAAALQTMQGLASTSSYSTGIDSGFDRKDVAGFQADYKRVSDLTDQFAKDNGMSRAQAAKILGSASSGIGSNALGVRGSIEGTSTAAEQEQFKRAQQFAEKTGYGEALKQALESGKSVAAKYNLQVGDQSSDQVQASLAATTQAQTQASASVEKAEAYRQAKERAESSGYTLSEDGQQQFLNFLAQYNADGVRGAAQLLTHASSGGDPAAQASVRRAAEEFGKVYAEHLAEGVGPTSTDIEAHGRANLSALQDRSAGEVRGKNAGDLRTVDARTAESAVPDRPAVVRSAGNLANINEVSRQTLKNDIDEGQTIVGAEGAQRRDDVEARTDPATSSLLFDAMDGAGKVLPGMDKLTDLRRMFVGGSEPEARMIDGKVYWWNGTDEGALQVYNTEARSFEPVADEKFRFDSEVWKAAPKVKSR